MSGSARMVDNDVKYHKRSDFLNSSLPSLGVGGNGHDYKKHEPDAKKVDGVWGGSALSPQTPGLLSMSWRAPLLNRFQRDDHCLIHCRC
jgi:hypothetical protein